MSYMQDQDLWEVVNRSETMQPEAEYTNDTLRKSKIKAGKAMFTLKTTKDDVPGISRMPKLPKKVGCVCQAVLKEEWCKTPATWKRVVLSVAQCDMTIDQYFHKVKSLCRKIPEWDPQAQFKK